MGTDLAVMMSPLLDAHPGIDPVPKPVEADVLVTQPAVERFVGDIPPRLARIGEGGLDRRVGEPAEDGVGNRLRRVVGA